MRLLNYSLTGLDGNELLKDQNFKRQASRCMQVLGAVVDNIDELQTTMGPVLLELGKLHYTFDGFLQKYWNVFPDAVLFVWNKQIKDFNPDAVKAWSAVLDMVISMLKEGYHQAIIDDTTKKLEELIDDTTNNDDTTKRQPVDTIIESTKDVL